MKVSIHVELWETASNSSSTIQV